MVLSRDRFASDALTDVTKRCKKLLDKLSWQVIALVQRVQAINHIYCVMISVFYMVHIMEAYELVIAVLKWPIMMTMLVEIKLVMIN